MHAQPPEIEGSITSSRWICALSCMLILQFANITNRIAFLHVSRNVWKVLWGYSFIIWVYVVAFQIVNPESPYWNLAWWLPWLRLDYLSEAAFVLSFLFAFLWQRTKE